MESPIDSGKKLSRTDRLVKSFYAELAPKNIHKKLSMIGRRKTTAHDKTPLGIKSADEAENAEQFTFRKHKDVNAKKIVRRFSFQPRDNFTENWVNRQNFFEKRNEKESTKSLSTTPSNGLQTGQFDDCNSSVCTVPVEDFPQIFVPFQSTPKILIDCVVTTDCEQNQKSAAQCICLSHWTQEGSRIPPFAIKPQAKQQNKNDLGWKQQNPADLLDVTGLNKYAQPTAGNTDTSVAPIDAADTQQDANSLIGRQSLGHLTASFAATPANFSPNSEEQSCPDTSTSKNTQEVDTKDNFLVNVEPAPTVVSSRRYSHLRWIDNMQARNSVTIALTAFYAMIVTIFALVFELSHLLTGENRRSVNSKDLSSCMELVLCSFNTAISSCCSTLNGK
uniref:Uncharacterized protein n=1 Tax=Ditylenchus dipsaci TaxID=166011 RepID=A0A915DG14_9BILA